MNTLQSVDNRRDWSNLLEPAPGAANGLLGQNTQRRFQSVWHWPHLLRRSTVPEETVIINICMLYKSGFSPERSSISAAAELSLMQVRFLLLEFQLYFMTRMAAIFRGRTNDGEQDGRNGRELLISLYSKDPWCK